MFYIVLSNKYCTWYLLSVDIVTDRRKMLFYLFGAWLAWYYTTLKGKQEVLSWFYQFSLWVNMPHRS